MYPTQLLKGTFETIILKLLTEHHSMYGYEIIQRVKELSDGEIEFPVGSLYPILHKMQERGLVTTKRVSHGKRVRRYYSITKDGNGVATEKVQEFFRFFQTMKLILNHQGGTST